jgi:hypothetical protein
MRDKYAENITWCKTWYEGPRKTSISLPTRNDYVHSSQKCIESSDHEMISLCIRGIKFGHPNGVCETLEHFEQENIF